MMILLNISDSKIVFYGVLIIYIVDDECLPIMVEDFVLSVKC